MLGRRHCFAAVLRYTVIAAAVSAGLVLLPIWHRVASAQYPVFSLPPAPNTAPDGGAVPDAAPAADGAAPDGAAPDGAAPDGAAPDGVRPDRPRSPRRPPRLDPAAVTAEAKADVDAEVTGAGWFVLGCLLGLIGVAIAYASEPTIQPSRLMGKSPDYVIIYTTAYKSAATSVQGGKALGGCALGVSLSLLIFLATNSGAKM